MTQVGKNIKKIRNVKGLSQQAFAELFDLTRGNISSYEEFRAEPKIEVIIQIANYFSIPLSDFIEKDLSVNELLHFNSQLVLEPEKIKLAQQLVKIPYIPALYVNDYVADYKNEGFLLEMPCLMLPCNSKFKLLALEIEDREMLPADYQYHNGDILILEQVAKENIHRIANRLGLMVEAEGIKAGIYKEKDSKLSLFLNEYVEYAFDLDSDKEYWVLRASIVQSL